MTTNKTKTRTAKTETKTTVRKSAKKAAAKTPAAKTPAAKIGRSSAKTEKAAAKKAATKSAKKAVGSIEAVPGLDDKFYHKFPRYAAYKMLLKAKGRKMTVANFLAKCEKLDGVGTEARARGIFQKLIDKKKHVGATCARLVA